MRERVLPPAKSAVAALALSLMLMPLSGRTQGAHPPAQAGAAQAASAAPAWPTQDALIQDAREALKKRDKSRLASLKAQALKQQHPLAPWVDYWDIGLRLMESSQSDLEAFYQRWSGSYVEDRLRNDWLLELGHRRDWKNFAIDYPRFRMNDDREVICYWLLSQYQLGDRSKPSASEALAAWMAQKEGDEGCRVMAQTLHEARVLSEESVWRKLFSAIESGKPKAARQAADLLSKPVEKATDELLENSARYLDKRASAGSISNARLTALALARRAQDNPEDAAVRMNATWASRLPPELKAWAWAQIGRQAGFKSLPESATHYRAAWEAFDRAPAAALPGWSDETLAWGVRAALKASDTLSWRLILRSVEQMSAQEQKESSWQFWRARALKETARSGAEGQAQREEAQRALSAIASPLSFYGKLATEELGRKIQLPPKPMQPTAAEREAAQGHAGLERALRLLALGLRSEGVREWNFSLRGMNDRQLLAAAQWACDREVWDRCINTSDRTQQEIDLEQRFPTPFRQDVIAKAAEIGIDPAYVYGLIRQESRFVTDARSHVGASGLMQVMPATAKWTAKKIGLPFKPEMITDRDANLKIGTSYLKLVLEDFGGSQAMAAAAYNAGPSRPRRWREGVALEAAAWAETIPFNETRDYVKKVLSNATLYSALLGQSSPSLKARLGPAIGPRESNAPAPDRDLP